jgi:CD109 antigen
MAPPTSASRPQATWPASLRRAASATSARLLRRRKNTGYEEKTTELSPSLLPPSTSSSSRDPAFKPTLPFNVLVITETPDGQPVESTVRIDLSYIDEDYNYSGEDSRTVETVRGVGTLTLTPPEDAQQVTMTASSGDAYAYKQVNAAYSPSGNFIHVMQEEPTELSVGSTAHFTVATTSEARNFYYEIVARDRVVFTSTADSPDIAFEVTPAMTGGAKLLVYQVLPTSEVAADFIPFDVQAAYPHQVTAAFSADESQPGDELSVDVQTEGPARSDSSPSTAPFSSSPRTASTSSRCSTRSSASTRSHKQSCTKAKSSTGAGRHPGAAETFEDAGLMIMTNKKVPDGKEPRARCSRIGLAAPLASKPRCRRLRQISRCRHRGRRIQGGRERPRRVQRGPPVLPRDLDLGHRHHRQRRPGDAARHRARQHHHLGPARRRHLSRQGSRVAEAEMRVFQPFFLSADLPYSAIRGEEFLKVALYNYTDSEQEFQVEIETRRGSTSSTKPRRR